MSVLYIKGKDGKFVPIFTVKGADGSNGIDGAGIEEIKYKSSEGLEDTYEITYTDDRTPTYFTVTNGKAGKDGETPEITIGDNGNWYINGKDKNVKAQGEDGVSPTVAVKEITGGHSVTITDKNGDNPFDVLDGKDGTSVEHRWEGTTLYVKSSSGTSSADLKGEKGDTGKGFTIKKVYQSYDEMVGDENGDDVEENEFVLISTDTEDPHNSQLYIKVKNNDGSFEYKFLNDLSGAQGIQGVGIQSIEKTASNGVVDTYTITYTDGNKTTFTVRNSENLNIENGSGNYSLQQKGYSASATGDYSAAFGRETKALQYGCFANGGETQAGRTARQFYDWIKKNNGKNNAGHTFYYNSNKESDSYITIDGYSAKYKYDNYETYANALGELCTAKGRGCFAAGLGAKIEEGYAAVTLGLNSELITQGLFPSFNIGGYVYSYGDYIFNIGHNSTLGEAIKDNNGKITSITYGSYLYSIGRDNTLKGSDVFAFGLGLKSTHGNQNRGKVLLGRYNRDIKPQYAYTILEVGDGYDDSNRFNVFHIYKDSKDLYGANANYITQFFSSVDFKGNVTVGEEENNKDLTVHGNSTFNGEVYIGDANNKHSLYVSDRLVANEAEIIGELTADSSLTVYGVVDLYNHLYAQADVQVKGKVTAESVVSKTFGYTYENNGMSRPMNVVDGSMAIGYGVQVGAKRSIGIGINNSVQAYQGNDDYVCESNYAFGESITIGTVAKNTIVVGKSCLASSYDCYLFGQGLIANGGGKVVLGRYNQEINYTDANHEKSTYSVFEIGDGAGYDSGSIDNRFNVFHIYKRNKNTYGSAAEYFSELRADLDVGEKRVSAGRMTCWLKPEVETDVVRKIDLLDFIYPVGSIYMSTVDKSPASFLGGKWEPMKDRFLVGAGGSYSTSELGGGVTHTHELTNGFAKALITDKYFRMDSAYTNNSAGVTVNYESDRQATYSAAMSYTTTSGNTAGIALGGKTVDANNLPPYVAVYMWKRIP